MILNRDNSKDGKSLQHNISKDSICTVKVGSRSLPLYPLVIVCLGMLNTILMLTPVVIGIKCEYNTPHQITAQELIIEVKELHTMQTKAIKAQEEAQQALEKELRSHQQLKLQLKHNKTINDAIERQYETLQFERAMLQSETLDLRENCGHCQSGWVLIYTSCYFHSSSAHDPLKNWQDSRVDCIRRGADLAVIDNLEEQVNLFEYLPKQNPSIGPWRSKPEGIWIGLTDIQTEGKWVWVNNVTQQDGGYWIQGEPNNLGPLGEDCAALKSINPRATWFDGNCQVNREWLCEMEPN
ncbi:CD209 antigen-like protein E isoform X2 [Etheostoma cragini]|uniref:CD209 antigen-like protein E isoform X2 n=1 Tax=Etheostoma cragini TaxID=417921 RepID=UPI00155F2E0D|nr:CD209 antigen-like protein E isoform X2 [Etheostoma cragini]